MAILCEAGVWRIEIDSEVATWLDNLAPPHFEGLPKRSIVFDASGNTCACPGNHMGLHRGVMTEHEDWDDIKARQAERDLRTEHDRHASRSAASLRFDLAQLVYGLRTNAGLTQRQLAERMGTTQSVISRLEQAGRLPTLELLGRIATATGADLRLLARHAGGGDADVRLSA